MAKPKRPRRQNKGDRLLAFDASKVEIECDYGIAPLDRVARQMDDKWGIDRLPELVSIPMAQKYGVAIAYLNECIGKSDPALCAEAAQNCIRGLAAMDAEAEASGAAKAAGALFEYSVESDDGLPFHFGVLADDREWPAAQQKRPDLVLVTMRQVANALLKYHTEPLQAELDKHFPQAKVTAILPRAKSKLGSGDTIPFAPCVL